MTPEVLAQYRAVREGVGLIDRSEAGKLAIRGSDRFRWLQGMVSADTRLLENGSTPRLQACLLNATGHLLSDATLLAVKGEDPFVLMELPRANLDKIYAVLDRFLITEDVEISDQSEEIGCFSLQGPRAAEIAQETQGPGAALSALWREAQVVEADHTGSGGLDLYFAAPSKADWRRGLAAMGIVGVEAEAQEILRVEAGIPKYGADMDESVIALEANLSPTHISLTKGCYVGQEIIARIDSRGHTNRALAGFVVVSGNPPAFGEKIYPLPIEANPDSSLRDVGRITSAIASSPAMAGRPTALGYVRHEHRAPGTRLRLGENDPNRVIETCELPFYLTPRPPSLGARSSLGKGEKSADRIDSPPSL